MTRVSVVIPTVGRASLTDAVASALQQEHVHEVLVMVDTPGEVTVPRDDRVRTIPVGDRTGSASARQRGVEAATGDVIGLLDDDDLWLPGKVSRQLEAVPPGDGWIVGCRTIVRRTGRPDRIWPRTVIAPHEPVPDYLFQMAWPRFGDSVLQTSTLLLPRSLALEVPLDGVADAVHDEPTWLMSVRAHHPGLPIHQLPDALAVYRVGDGSLSTTLDDDSPAYIAWGRQHLDVVAPRTRGDYYLTSAVTAAAGAGSVAGMLRAARAGFAEGRPGPGATAYATLKIAQVAARRGGRFVRRAGRP
ncbi:MAG: glycosyltransferase [Aeromicrobium sp.]